MKGSPSKLIALKTNVIGPENILFAGASVHRVSPEILQAGAVKGVNGRSRFFSGRNVQAVKHSVHVRKV